MEAGRKVLYLQVASGDEVYQSALVIFLSPSYVRHDIYWFVFFPLFDDAQLRPPWNTTWTLFPPFSVIRVSVHSSPITRTYAVFLHLNRPRRIELRATARCSLLWLRTSSPSPSCSGTRWLSAAPTGWSRRRSSSSCPWWWICSQRTLSPVLSAGPWCTVSVSSCHGGKASHHAGAPPHLFKNKRTKRWGGQPGVLRTIQLYLHLNLLRGNMGTIVLRCTEWLMWAGERLHAWRGFCYIGRQHGGCPQCGSSAANPPRAQAHLRLLSANLHVRLCCS